MTVTSDDIRRMFSRLAPRYDRFNRWSSLGLDRAWRRELARGFRPGDRLLDVGCGTGDLTLLAASKGCAATGLDFSAEMVAAARKRSTAAAWVEGGAGALPFPDGSFDVVTSAYVLRNLFRGGLLEASLKEAFRVLGPGGRLLFLDLTRPGNFLLRWGHGVYMRTVLPAVGRLVCGDSWPGDYLRTSIEELPPRAALEKAFATAGFLNFRIDPLAGGIVSVFSAGKL